MRSVVGLLLAVALAAAIPILATPTNGAPPPEKPQRVKIAHLAEIVEGYVDEDGDFGEPGTVGTLYQYHVIMISDRAKDAHVAHGDIYPTEEDVGTWFDEFEPAPEPEP